MVTLLWNGCTRKNKALQSKKNLLRFIVCNCGLWKNKKITIIHLFNSNLVVLYNTFSFLKNYLLSLLRYILKYKLSNMKPRSQILEIQIQERGIIKNTIKPNV